MTDADPFTVACIVTGALLIAMTIANSFIARLPLSAAMLYLAVGVGIGPWGLGLVSPDPFGQAQLLERLTEVAVLISLFVRILTAMTHRCRHSYRLFWLVLMGFVRRQYDTGCRFLFPITSP